MATVITPHPAWMGSGAVAPLSDPLARWINFGVTSGNYGAPGSALYAVPFWVTSSNITSATLTMEGGVDDFLGDWFSGGANPIGCYVNGTPFSAFSVFNYSAPTSATQDITSAVTPGLNYLYLYQRDGGVLVSGLIFSGTIEIVPAPGSMALIFFGGLLTSRRRRD